MYLCGKEFIIAFDYFDAASESLTEDRNEMNDYNTYMDLLNNNEYYFESSGDINKANLAYYTSQTAVNNFTTHMLDRYLTNYDIDIVRDKDFKEKVLDPTFKKTWDIEVNQLYDTFGLMKQIQFTALLSTNHKILI